MNPMFMNQHPWNTTDTERINAMGKLLGKAVADRDAKKDMQTMSCISQW